MAEVPEFQYILHPPDGAPAQVVSKKAWVKAERDAGFNGPPGEPSCWSWGGYIQGLYISGETLMKPHYTASVWRDPAGEWWMGKITGVKSGLHLENRECPVGYVTCGRTRAGIIRMVKDLVWCLLESPSSNDFTIEIKGM
jgi:hypothetical protein